MVDPNRRDVAHADEFRCLDPGMSRNYSVGPISQDGIDKSEFFDTRSNLLDLFRSVRAWIL